MKNPVGCGSLAMTLCLGAHQTLNKVTAILARITVFSVFYLYLAGLSQAAGQENLLYEVQWHRLLGDSAGQMYMRGKLPTPLRSTDLPAPVPLSSERTALAVNLLDEPVASLDICAKTNSWWVGNTVETLHFHGERKAVVGLSGALEPACSSLVDEYGIKHQFIPEGASNWPGLLDLVIFELTPVKPGSTSLPQTQKSWRRFMASSGATGDSFWHDPKWRFYPGFMQPSQGYLDIFPLWANPFARLFLHPDSQPPQDTEDLVIRFINDDGTDRVRTISPGEFADLTEAMSVSDPDFWKTLAGSEVSVRVGTITDLSVMCTLSLSAEVVQLAQGLLCAPVQTPHPDEQKKSEAQLCTDSGSHTDSRQPGSCPWWVSTGGRNSEGGAGGGSQPPEDSKSDYVFSDDDQALVDRLVLAAQEGEDGMVKDLVLRNGKRLLFGLHSVFGESALHAAIKAEQYVTMVQIQYLCTETEYSQLMLLPNRLDQTPMLLLQGIESPDLLRQLPDAGSQGSIIAPSSYAQLSEMASRPYSNPVHPLVEEADEVHLEDPTINQCFEKYNLDLKHYRNPAFQEASMGRKVCVVHPGFYHAEMRLPCCDSYICQPAVIALARMIIAGFIRKHDDRIDCPNCRQPLDLTVALEDLRENAKQRVTIEALRPISPVSKAISSENPRLIYHQKIFDFTEDILNILKDHIEIKKRFENKVVFLEDTECEICMDTTNCIQLSREQECTHQFCLECLKQYIESSAIDLNALSACILTCPGTDCSVQIPDYVVQAITGKHILKKLHLSLMKLAASKSKTLFLCLNPDCDNVLDIKDACDAKIVCNRCDRTSCSNCKVTPFHEGWSCQLYQTALTSHGAEAMFEAFKKRESHNFKNCPVCKADIYKDMGCNLIHCSSCHEKFCWLCSQVITKEQYKHFHKGKCPLFEEPHRANQPVYVIAGAAEAVQRVEQPYCLRCHTENMLEQWVCGHYFCSDCQTHMLIEADAAGQPLDKACLGCFGEAPERKREPMPHPECDQGELFSGASGYTPAPTTSGETSQVQSWTQPTGQDQPAMFVLGRSDREEPQDKLCLICFQEFEAVDTDLCEACMRELYGR